MFKKDDLKKAYGTTVVSRCKVGDKICTVTIDTRPATEDDDIEWYSPECVFKGSKYCLECNMCKNKGIDK